MERTEKLQVLQAACTLTAARIMVGNNAWADPGTRAAQIKAAIREVVGVLEDPTAWPEEANADWSTESVDDLDQNFG